MKKIISICFLIASFIGYRAHAQYRSAAFTVQHEQTEQTVSLGQTFETDGNIELTLLSPIYGFSVSGSVTLKDTSNSLVRITLVDDYDMEYLVYEIYPLLTQQWQFDFDNMGFETSNMDEANISKMKISVLNAELTLKEYHYATEPPRSIQRQQRFKTQQQYIIETLNANLEARNIPWRAGETSVSKLSYEEKKNLFGGTIPNLNGFEYYIGGIFVMPGYQPESSAQTQEAEPKASVPSSWDWRNKDGKNWMTPVKNQGSCGACWVFASLSVLEAYINIQFNQLLNFDLSEQDVISCYNNGNGCLSGGHTWWAFDYIHKCGVVTESCFPYIEANGKCADKCNSPNETIKVSYTQFNHLLNGKNALKKKILESPLTFCIKPWQHAMTLVGYKTIQSGDKVYTSSSDSDYVTIDDDNSLIGETAWLLKNSWGTDFGDQGYAYVVLKKWGDIMDILAAEGDITGITSINSSVNWDDNNAVDKLVLIEQGGVLEISTTVDVGSGTIIVQNGGKLIVNGGILNNAAIEVESGGSLQIINNGTINLRSSAALNIQNGGSLDFVSGYIK